MPTTRKYQERQLIAFLMLWASQTVGATVTVIEDCPVGPELVRRTFEPEPGRKMSRSQPEDECGQG